MAVRTMAETFPSTYEIIKPTKKNQKKWLFPADAKKAVVVWETEKE